PAIGPGARAFAPGREWAGPPLATRGRSSGRRSRCHPRQGRSFEVPSRRAALGGRSLGAFPLRGNVVSCRAAFGGMCRPTFLLRRKVFPVPARRRARLTLVLGSERRSAIRPRGRLCAPDEGGSADL